MTRTDAWYAFNFTIMKTLEYPMVAMTLTEAEWNKVMSPLLAAALPTSIPWEIYGSRKGHRAIEWAANKVLTTDISRQEH
jgi:hypothetical protein